MVNTKLHAERETILHYWLNSTRSAIDWPENSPDLNPIKNLLQIIKDKVEWRMPQIIEQLKQFLTEEWEAIPNETVIDR